VTEAVVGGNKGTKTGDDVVNRILNVVHERGLRIGDQLPSIRQLAHRLDMKQSAVRHALLKAETMGLVKVMPRAGAFLKSGAPAGSASALDGSLSTLIHSALHHDEQNVFHLLDARRLIEIEVVGRVAERRRLEDLLPVRRALEAMLHLPADAARSEYIRPDIRFHTEIARLSGNHVLFTIQRALLELLRPYLTEAPFGNHRRTTTDQVHAAIYEALVAGDPEKARDAMRTHLNQAYDCLLRDLREVPSPEQSARRVAKAHLSPEH